MLELSEENILRWSNYFYLVALGIAAVSSALIYQYSAKLSRENDERLQRYQSAAQIQIANAQTAGDQARADAARANERTSTLELATAEAVKEQERLREANSRLQLELQKFASRRLTQEQGAAISTALRGSPCSIAMISLGDMEASVFAADILAALTAATCQVQRSFAGQMSPPSYGLIVAEPGGREGQLTRALIGAGLAVQSSDVPPGNPP
jgi:hypothetical protein